MVFKIMSICTIQIAIFLSFVSVKVATTQDTSKAIFDAALSGTNYDTEMQNAHFAKLAAFRDLEVALVLTAVVVSAYFVNAMGRIQALTTGLICTSFSLWLTAIFSLHVSLNQQRLTEFLISSVFAAAIYLLLTRERHPN